MTTNESENIPKCWSQRLWWPFVLAAMISSYFVLRNYQLTYWKFMGSFAAFIAVGATLGHYLGMWIDRRFRTEGGLLRQERRTSKELLTWLRRLLRKHEGELEIKVVRKFSDSIDRLEGLLGNPTTDRYRILEERGTLQDLIEKNLTQFRHGVVREYVEPFAKAAVIALLLRAFVIEPFQIPSGSMVPTIMFGDHIFANKLSYGVRVPFLPRKIFGHEIEAISWNWSMPRRGDIIVFVTPEDKWTKSEDYIKRVVALPGEEITVKDSVIYINGKPFEQRDEQPFEFNDLDTEGRFLERVATKKFDEILDELHHPILRLTRCNLRSKCDCDENSGLCQQKDYGPFTVPEGHVFCMGDNRDSSKDSRSWGPVPLTYIKGKAEFIWWSYRENQVRWERMFRSMY